MTEVESSLTLLPPEPETQAVLEVISEAFEQLGGDPRYLAGMKMAAPGVGELFGVRVPILRKLARGVLRVYRRNPVALRSIALEAWQRKSREHRLFALFVLAGVKKIPPAERWDLGVKFLPEVSNWEICDQLCSTLLGQALSEDPQYMDVLETWISDENFWVRRASLVAPVLLRRAKYPNDLALDLDRRTLAICAALINDGEKYIRKAVDWSVRGVIARHYELARDWMMSQAAAGLSRTARTTLKLAAKKLTKHDRNAFITLIES